MKRKHSALLLSVSILFSLFFSSHAYAQQAITPTLYCVGGSGVPPCAAFPSESTAPSGGISPSPIITSQAPSTQPSSAPITSVDPCATGTTSAFNNGGKHHHKWRHRGGGGFFEQFFQWLIKLIQQFLGGSGAPIPGAPSPSTAPQPSTGPAPSQSPCPSPTTIVEPSPSTQPQPTTSGLQPTTALSTTPIVADPSSRLFTGDFEPGDFSQWEESQATGAWSQQIVTSPVRQGKYAARFEIRDGDCPITNGTCYGERSERGAGSVSGGQEGDERWYQWSTQFGTPFPNSHTWGVVSQWHSETDGSPPVSFDLDGVGDGNWGLALNIQDSPANYVAVYHPWKTSLAPGTWHDMKVHIMWSASDTVGFIELWHDGVKQTFTDAPCAGQTKCMVRTLVPGGGGTYFKQGYYRDEAVSGTGVIYHDGFTAAKTEAGLEPL